MPEIMGMPTVDQIDAILPQTQCTQCGFDGCMPYAQAIAEGGVPINRCPPGGQAGVDSLARLLRLPSLPLDETRGHPGALTVAVIDEAHCIGCTLCIQACPVDAIVGANKHMHTVLADWCTGCDLCIAPCPVDCISMQPAGREWTPADAALARTRHRSRAARLTRFDRIEESRLASHRLSVPAPPSADSAVAAPDVADDGTASAHKREAINTALARARARRKTRQP
jgi:electron transport complex protein RnfB